MSLTVDIIVPVYGNWQVTEKCLQSLRSQTMPHHVILVDDKSPDDTLERLRGGYSEVEVVALAVNSGFAAACNRGLAIAQADVVVLLNNDVEAQPEMIERLVGAFADPEVGSATPLLLRPDGRVDAFGITADVTMAGFLIMHGAETTQLLSSEYRLLGPYGAAAAYRRAAISEVGMLDEGIFMYGEELDLALRLSAAGWKPAAVPDALGTHLGGATSGRGSATQRRRASFGRGYLLRAYGVLQSRDAVRAIVTEGTVCIADAILSQDLASVRGRFEGWRAGKATFTRTRAIPDLDRSIGFLRSLRLRIMSR